MSAMPATPDLTRRTLVPVAPRAAPSGTKSPVIRRYRLSRVPLYTRPDPALDRFGHLRRSYD